MNGEARFPQLNRERSDQETIFPHTDLTQESGQVVAYATINGKKCRAVLWTAGEGQTITRIQREGNDVTFLVSNGNNRTDRTIKLDKSLFKEIQVAA